MNRKVSYVIISSLATLLYFIAVGHDGWRCGNGIFSRSCPLFYVSRLTGALLLTAGVLSFLVSALLVVSLWRKWIWVQTVALLVIGIAAIISMIAIFLYTDNLGLWSPLFATIAMSFALTFIVMMLFDIIIAHWWSTADQLC